MNPRLHADITTRLDRDFAFKRQGLWLRQGVCPSCGKKELYANADAPWVLRCGRLEKCGHVEHVKDRYSDLFESWSDRHPTTPDNPNAAADAYLRDHRGFDLDKIAGWYSQENYWNPELQLGSATVRFALPGVGYWERLIDRPQRFGKRKATFRGSYMGTWWQAPGMSFSGVDEIWITEGIFDAIALILNGVVAVSTLSCNNYPEAALAAMAEQMELGRPDLVFAYDTGKAGEDFTKKHVARAIKQGWKATAAQPPKGRQKYDWNELHQLDRLSERDLDEYRYYGALLLAASAAEKGKLMYSRHGWNSFPFDFDKRLYWWKLDIDKQVKAEQNLTEAEDSLNRDEREAKVLEKSNTVTEICNCLPTPLYYLRNDITDEAWYYFRVEFPHGGASIKNTFTAGQISAAAEFKKRLLHMAAGAIWTGSAGQLDRLLSRWTYNIKRVETIDYIGYTLEHGAYVFGDVAVQGDRVVEVNEEDYFDLGKLAIKSLSKSLKLDINADPKAPQVDWFDKLYFCFGPRGVAALAAWFGSLFAEQIRHRFESFPFVEIVGEPGSGKSTLIEALWKLLGRGGYEGFDPMKASAVGLMRSMAQVSNLPVVLIESDREDEADGTRGRVKQAFHWDGLKSLYNGGSLRTTGVKSSGNDTYDPQFRGALFISQNNPVQASMPIMERIVHLWFDKSRQTEAGRAQALELGRMTARELSPFLPRALTHEQAVLALMEERLRTYEREIAAAGSKNQRIQKNHAQLMVFVDALAMACPITPTQQAEAKALLVQLALQREQALQKDHPLVEAFWEAFDYLDGTGEGENGELEGESRLNHSRDPAYIAVNLNHFMQVAADRRQQVPPLQDLKRLLKTSRRPRYIDSNVPTNSAVHGRLNARCENLEHMRPTTVRCWVFKVEG
ncbi:toprim domain-containing protein [Thauera butanivorans]|uniref:toprim domain-containing protein n=1 Tax=Thauera butanivorans TaxID=86174 RepID=UPI0008391905|nr:toprim domain-containing protein [Thauera butanivorans]